MKEAWLVSISRGFGGDNAIYEDKSKPTERIMVCVGWALCCPYQTVVLVDGDVVATFDDLRYIQPPEALARLGYVVHGLVDFASTVVPEDAVDKKWVSGSSREQSWCRSLMYKLGRSSQFPSYLLNSLRRAYFSNKIDGTILSLREIAAGEIRIRNVGDVGRSKISEALQAHDLKENP